MEEDKKCITRQKRRISSRYPAFFIGQTYIYFDYLVKDENLLSFWLHLLKKSFLFL